MRRSRLACLGLALSATLLGACAQKSPPPVAPAPVAAADSGMRVLADDAFDSLLGIHERMMSQLGLTAEQRQRLMQIRARYRSQLPVGEIRTLLQRLRDEITASTVDSQAIHQTLTDLEDSYRNMVPGFVSMASEARGVLTAEQRQAVVTQLDQSWAEINRLLDQARVEGFQRLSANMTLSPQQQQGLESLQAADKRADDAKLAIMRDAWTQFVSLGDEAAFTSSLQSMTGRSPIDESIGWLLLLDQTQRRQLAQNYETYVNSLLAKLSASTETL